MIQKNDSLRERFFVADQGKENAFLTSIIKGENS